jgi:hypothetical protein
LALVLTLATLAAAALVAMLASGVFNGTPPQPASANGIASQTCAQWRNSVYPTSFMGRICRIASDQSQTVSNQDGAILLAIGNQDAEARELLGDSKGIALDEASDLLFEKSGFEERFPCIVRAMSSVVNAQAQDLEIAKYDKGAASALAQFVKSGREVSLATAAGDLGLAVAHLLEKLQYMKDALDKLGTNCEDPEVVLPKSKLTARVGAATALLSRDVTAILHSPWASSFETLGSIRRLPRTVPVQAMQRAIRESGKAGYALRPTLSRVTTIAGGEVWVIPGPAGACMYRSNAKLVCRDNQAFLGTSGLAVASRAGARELFTGILPPMGWSVSTNRTDCSIIRSSYACDASGPARSTFHAPDGLTLSVSLLPG